MSSINHPYVGRLGFDTDLQSEIESGDHSTAAARCCHNMRQTSQGSNQEPATKYIAKKEGANSIFREQSTSGFTVAGT